MKKFLVLLAAVLVAVTSCGQNIETESAVNKVNYVNTGEPAIDTSLRYLPQSELVAYGLLKEDESTVNTKSVNLSDVSVYLYGPLHDRRLVKGKDAGFSLFIYNTSVIKDTEFSVKYGFSPDSLIYSATMYSTGYGNRVVFINIPNESSISKLYFKIVGNQGTVIDNNGVPFEAKIYDAIVSVSGSYPHKITINYSGPLANYGTYIHYGWNNWNNITEVSTGYYPYRIDKYAEPGGYISATFDIPDWANYIDFVLRNGTAWDNNDGKDWHYSVKPIVDIRISEIYKENKKTISVYYAFGTLSPVTLHYGFNNWQRVNETKMYAGYYLNEWTGYVDALPQDSVINMVFRDDNNNWENNFGMNWNFEL